MPIVIRLDVMLAKRKIHLKRLSEKTCIPVNNLSSLNSGRAKDISFVALNRICEALSCQTGELLEYMTDQEYRALFFHYEFARVSRNRRLKSMEEREKDVLKAGII